MLLSFLLLAAALPDAGYAALNRAYQALREKAYPAALSAFREASAAAPERADIRKDLAYTLLKVGETEAARDEFGAAMLLDPSDVHVALEYAFLCHETRRTAEARRIFDRIRRTGNVTAEHAFQNIDRPLAEGIQRWKRAVELAPGSFSAHQELARLAEQRDELQLASEHYQKAWRIRPRVRSLLVDIGRARKLQGRHDESMAALLAASRGSETRVSEQARELLPERYPYVYEFRNALELDPTNIELRRELAYLYLAMDRKLEAEAEFQIVVGIAPDDLLSVAQLGFLRLNRQDVENALPLLEQVLAGEDEHLAERVRAALRRPDPPRKKAAEAKMLAERSLEAGYLKDALKYLTIAHRNDPSDHQVLLNLGWTSNNLRRDKEALEWFRLARSSPDPALASEANRAYRNLWPAFARIRTTAWSMPFYSSRWRDAFHYAQVKTDFRLGRLPLRPYLSARFIGDIRREQKAPLGAGLLSENAIILGAGVATQSFRGFMAWAEAGTSAAMVRSLQSNRIKPDYRGGVSYARGFGSFAGRAGRFAEINADGVFLSRFGNDTILYLQNRAGYSLGKVQAYWSTNFTTDAKRQHWANFAEFGPGVRFRLQGPLMLCVHAMRGHYLLREGNPFPPAYFDLRIGFWYAVTR